MVGRDRLRSRLRVAAGRPGRLGALGAPTLWTAVLLLLLVPIGLFLALAVSPALLGQGRAWFTLANLGTALQGSTRQGLVDSLLVATVTAGLSVAIGLGLAWLTQRTTVAGRRLWGVLMWVVLLTPSFLTALGWERLIEVDGLLSQMGLPLAGVRAVFFGPAGVVLVLVTKGVPFAYLAVANALAALGQEFEDAARVHGAGRWAALRVTVPILAPALWAGLAIVFAETISDFGVATTIASTANFPIATQTLFAAVDTFPANFPVAAAVGWLLVASVSLALLAQTRALRGRSYAVLSGRTRPAPRRRRGPWGQAAALAAVGGFFVLSLGVPGLGAVSASLLRASATTLTWGSLTDANYVQLLRHATALGPLLLSTRLALVAGTLAVAGGLIVAHLMARRRAGVLPRLLDLLLLATVGLPGIVLGAGYIFAYNLPLLAHLGWHLYGTIALLGMAYLANSLPTASRLLMGPMAQVQSSLQDAARVHGGGAARAWRTTVVPLLARSLLWAWLFSFTGILFELPISQLLAPPGQEPLAVAITQAFATYSYGPGTTLMVAAVAYALVIVGAGLGAFRLLAPRGWLHIGAAR